VNTALEHGIAVDETRNLLSFPFFIIGHSPWLITSAFWTVSIEILGLA
jgi:hypothetical protein